MGILRNFLQRKNIHHIQNVEMGANVRVISPVNLYGCSLGDDVQIGPFTEIQDGVKVGRGTKVQSHSFICSLVTIGQDCFIGHGVMFTNDLLRGGPAQGDRTLWAETRIGNRVAIGSNATILPVTVCDDVTIGAGAVVTQNINHSGIYVGNPARRLQKVKR